MPFSQPWPLLPFAPSADAGQVHVMLSPAPHGALRLDYRLAVPELRLPPPAPSCRTDGLWRHTCCELFMATVDGRKYREFNFSPAGAWAVYDFADYRDPLAEPEVSAPPQIVAQGDAQEFRLQATLPAALLPPGPWHIGLSAVLENQAGDLGYWALAHPGERPDFHRRDAFTLALAPAQLNSLQP